MYFDLAPKARREDLFDFDEELRKLELMTEHGRLVLILAPRRYGKSSLLKVFLNERRHPFVFLDLRRVVLDYGRLSFRGLYEALSAELTKFIVRHRDLGERLVELMRGVRGVSILGSTVKFSWR